MNKVSAAVFAQEGDQYLGRKYKEMDCQAFVERMLRGVGIRVDLAGSNAWYREMDWIGTPEECVETFGCVPVGAFLYIWQEDGAPKRYLDGWGNAYHMGVYIGRMGGAIHSSQSRGEVCYSNFKGKSINGGWNRVGLWCRMDYGERVNKRLGGDNMTEKDYIVTAESGSSVNLRSKASIGGELMVRVPLGETVTASPVGDGKWSAVRWGKWYGYMMTKFLKAAEDVTSDPLSVIGTSSADSSPQGEPRDSASFQALEQRMTEMENRMKLLEAVIAAL